MTNQSLTSRKLFNLSDEQQLNWLRLMRSQNVGPITFRDLISHFGTAAAAIDALPELARRGGAAARIKICPKEDAEREMDRCMAFGAKFIALGEPEYPAVLRSSEQSPPMICLKGNTDVLSRKSVGIVGSRNASISGMKLTQRFSAQLGEAGYIIVSGLARGIDATAHKSALATGTIAVFAGGLDCVFPEENQGLSSDILDNDGAIVSEMPMGWQPRAKDFPRRNRIVTGLSLAVVIVEAAKRSGSLITARLANEMGRLVLAVPGSPLDPRSEGTNSLIKQGASLVTSTEDIIDAMTPLHSDEPDFIYDIHEDENTIFEEDRAQMENADDTLRHKIVSALGPSPTDIDDIIRFTGASAGQTQLVLMELSLAGRLERQPGNRVCLIA